MSKKAEEVANELFPEPKLENYDDILIYRADRDNAIMGRAMCYRVYEQAEKDLALTWEDMAKIDAIILDVNNEFAVDYSKEIDRQKIYEEVLKRFKEIKYGQETTK